MKKFLLAGLIAVAALTVSVSSCGKYEDGPAFSLLSKKSRLANEWVLDQYFIDDVDQTAAYKAAVGDDYVWVIEKDEKYHIQGSATDEGTWELGEDKDDIRFQSTSNPNASEVSYRILRLKSKELWMRYTASNGQKHKLYLKSK